MRVLARTGKVDWNLTDSAGRTPLYYALYYGHSDIVDILVKIPGINFNVKTVFGWTPAHIAVKKGVVRDVETLTNQDHPGQDHHRDVGREGQ